MKKYAKLYNGLQTSELEIECQGSPDITSSTQALKYLAPNTCRSRGFGKISVQHEVESSECPVVVGVYIMRFEEDLSRHCHKYTAELCRAASESMTSAFPWGSNVSLSGHRLTGELQ